MENIDNTPDTTPEEYSDFEIEDLNSYQEEDTGFNTEELEETEELEGTEEQEQQEEAPFLQVKYNKEDKALSKEEAIMLAQKGMNYDKVIEKLNSIESDPNIGYLKSLAERNNMSLEGLVDYWKQQEEEAELNELLQRNIPEDYAREMLENKKFREEIQKKEIEQQQKAKQDKEFKDFFAAYPKIDPKNIPNEVWEVREREGIPLKYAYLQHENSQLVKEKEILLNNNKNRKKAPGLGTTQFGHGEAPNKDPFMEGFEE